MVWKCRSKAQRQSRSTMIKDCGPICKSLIVVVVFWWNCTCHQAWCRHCVVQLYTIKISTYQCPLHSLVLHQDWNTQDQDHYQDCPSSVLFLLCSSLAERSPWRLYHDKKRTLVNDNPIFMVLNNPHPYPHSMSIKIAFKR